MIYPRTKRCPTIFHSQTDAHSSFRNVSKSMNFIEHSIAGKWPEGSPEFLKSRACPVVWPLWISRHIDQLFLQTGEGRDLPFLFCKNRCLACSIRQYEPTDMLRKVKHKYMKLSKYTRDKEERPAIGFSTGEALVTTWKPYKLLRVIESSSKIHFSIFMAN